MMPADTTIRERVLTIHGIESSGDWQEDVARAFAPHFECKTIKYPHYRWLGPVKLLLEPSVLLFLGMLCAGALLAVNHTARAGWLTLAALFFISYLASYARRSCAFKHILQQIGSYATPEDQSETHLIAHSLGTYLMGLALRKRPDIHLGRVVLVGCVLPRSYPWQNLAGLAGKYKFLDVRNEVGQKDIVVWSAWMMSWLIRGLGVAGLRGFKPKPDFVHTLSAPGTSCPAGASCSAKVHNMLSQFLGHSDAFVGSGYAETFWLPYLWGIDPREYQQFLLFCKTAAGLEHSWSAAARSQGIEDPRLIDVERQLLQADWRWCNGSFEDYVLQEVKSKKSGTVEDLNQLAAIAARGVWQVIHMAVAARLNRQARLSIQSAAREQSFAQKVGLNWRRHRIFSNAELVYDPVEDEMMKYLNPHLAIRLAVERLP
jgi:pimeloyl-ACP methyl ester carboxylesterase